MSMTFRSPLACLPLLLGLACSSPQRNSNQEEDPPAETGGSTGTGGKGPGGKTGTGGSGTGGSVSTPDAAAGGMGGATGGAGGSEPPLPDAGGGAGMGGSVADLVGKMNKTLFKQTIARLDPDGRSGCGLRPCSVSCCPCCWMRRGSCALCCSAPPPALRNL